ncbi:MAG: HAMP domain-containing histidine kinase [Pseudanabaena sp. SU_2_4]|nr:HAMP domain-containing histidine kinase [Pseudanabaena sp. SU_2_4]
MELMWFLLGFAAGLSLLCICLAGLYIRLRREFAQQGFILSQHSLLRSLLPATNTHEPHIQPQLQENYDWQYILQSAPIGYLEVDEENRLCWGNVQAYNLLGIQLRQNDLTAKRLLLQLVRSYELDLLIAETRTAQKSQQKKWEFNQIVPDPLHPVQQQGRMLRGHSIPLDNGNIGIFIEDCQEAAILQQQRDRWASDVAHELKTPLTSIRLIVETLHSRVTPELQDWMERLLNEVIRLGNLVEDLLDLGQMDTSMSLHLNRQDIDLHQLMQSAWMSLEPLATKRQVSLEYLGPDSLCIQADESRIYRLLLNLLDNSIKHSPRSQAVLVKLGIENEFAIPHAAIEVIDRGSGISRGSFTACVRSLLSRR